MRSILFHQTCIQNTQKVNFDKYILVFVGERFLNLIHFETNQSFKVKLKHQVDLAQAMHVSVVATADFEKILLK